MTGKYVRVGSPEVPGGRSDRTYRQLVLISAGRSWLTALGRRGDVGPDDVGHDAGDVVVAAAVDGKLDQASGRLVGIAHLPQHLPDGFCRRRLVQAVGAQQVTVAQAGLAKLEVGLGVAEPRARSSSCRWGCDAASSAV